MLITPHTVNGQEFDCSVTVNIDQLEGSSFNYLENLKPILENYINEYQWTEQDFAEEERIDCQIQVAINSGTSDYTFSAEVVFQVQRPIYNTTAKTTTILLSDNAWQFSYPEGKSLIHDELQFDALTGFIDFYCYTMLGYDFDTFSEHGGDPYFGKAQNILNLAESTSAIGWARSTNNRRNRNTMITDLVSSNYQPLRTAYYQYHRHGLDQFVADPDVAREEILNALKTIQEAKRRSTSNFLFDIFFDTKAREIAAVFDEAETDVRLEAYDVLQNTDQGHLSEYESLQN
ncbi:DUF4835 family protein [Gracilimonas sp.]|uniref:type IX secretion system protein PorD n=1 Tax=Gracilimonas sp. TaxID=1974203 RepID=UPI003BACE6AE